MTTDTPRAARRSGRSRARNTAQARALLAATAAAFLTACGAADAPPDTGTCRSYAKRYEVSGTALSSGFPFVTLPRTVDCAFARDRLVLECSAAFEDANGTPVTQTKTWTYASVDDFVAEAASVGRLTNRSYHFVNPGAPVGGPPEMIPGRPLQFDAPVGASPEVHNTFAADQRLLRGADTEFIAWDDKGRPTRSAFTPLCTTDQGHRFAYDDAARTVTHEWDIPQRPPGPGTGERACAPQKHVFGYDADGNVVSLTVGTATSRPTHEYRVVEREVICTGGSR